MVTLTIDGKKVSVANGKTVLDAANEAGISIPTLCHNERLLPYGACRLCTVEVGRNGKHRLQASCAYPAEEGLDVKTDTDRVIRGRRMMAELLLARCPGVKAVQKVAADLGVRRSRFRTKDETCILCGQCVRVCEEIVGVGAVSFAGRGIFRKVQTPFDKPSDQCIACGACTYVCPTGHIQMEYETRQRWRREIPGLQRLCRYARMGAVSYKVCPNSFHCESCEVDQSMEDVFGMHPALALRPAARQERERIAQFELLRDLHYTRGHVWTMFMDGSMRLGIDDFTRAIMHRIERVRVQPPGTNLRAGEVLWEVESKGKKLPMLAPVAGTVVSINKHLEVDPPLASREPFGRGWIALLTPKSRRDMEACRSALLTGDVAGSWLAEDAERLYAWSAPGAKELVADGGYLEANLPATLNNVQWRALITEFFGHA